MDDRVRDFMGFCTRCGESLVRQRLETDERERDVCRKCGTIHYENPKLLVSCIPYFQDRILLGRRATEPARGLWNPISGFVEMQESLEDAASRELFEETGLRVPAARMQLSVVLSLPHISQIYIHFLTQLQEEPQFRINAELLDLRLFSEHEFPFGQLAFEEMITANLVRALYRQVRTGDGAVYSYQVRLRDSQTIQTGCP